MSRYGGAEQAGSIEEMQAIARYSLLGELVVQEVERNDLLDQLAVLRDVLKRQTQLLDRLSESVANAYMTELGATEHSPETRRAELVRRLLAGIPVDSIELDYNIDAEHIGLIASGIAAAHTVRTLAARLDCQLLSVARGDIVWAWLGGNLRLANADIERRLTSEELVGVSLALGEPAQGLTGWRLTHKQAQAALRIAVRRPQNFTWHADVALEAFAMQDETIARSFIDFYLSPLDGRRCSGAVLRAALREYFAAGRNATAASAALNVSRRTLRNYMAILEETLGPLLDTRQAELELALRLDVLFRK
ncbi:MAG TPA: helix-turn-helix domain-containing protein [Solirubrobacteraceae bacterium]|nr:helix-turn-helix domain-containing protein [Solirubrobacteraceae bacterium]